MSDTTNCPNCTATLPAAAAFCTSCGARLTPAPAPAQPAAAPETAPPPLPGPNTFAPPPDPTRVDGPSVTDPTQVLGASPPTAPSAPWQPADGGAGATWAAPSPTSAPAPPGVAPAPAPATMPAAPPAPYGAPATSPPAVAQAPAWSPTSWEAQQPSPSQRSTKAGGGSILGAGLAALGGIVTLVGLFMPWVKSGSSSAGLSGWDLTSGDKGFLTDSGMLTFESPDPYVILVLAVGALITGLLAYSGGTRNLSRILGVVLGVGIIGLMIRDWSSLANVVETQAPSTFEVSSDIGFYLAIAGGALVILSAAMPAQAKRSPEPVPIP